MSTEALAALCMAVWLVGAVITFRWEAQHLIKKRNKRRRDAIREAAYVAPLWPLLVIGSGVLYLLRGAAWVFLAGLPESQADRDAETKRLEREVLDIPLEEAVRAATEPLEAREGKRLSAEEILAATARKHEIKMPADRIVSALVWLQSHGVTSDPTDDTPIMKAIRRAYRDAERDRLVSRRDPWDVAMAESRAKKLELHVRVYERAMEKAETLKCSKCLCPVVPGRTGYVHIPSVGSKRPCPKAVVLPDGFWRHEIRVLPDQPEPRQDCRPDDLPDIPQSWF